MLHVLTGSRLHFGLLELAENQPNRYGGLGMMIQIPSLRLRLNRAGDQHLPLNGTQGSHELQRRIDQATAHTLQALGVTDTYDGPRVELIECPPMHSGLGVGTQLAAAVAMLIERDYLLEHPSVPLPSFTATCGSERVHQAVARLAHLSGRGKRSAIGLHGFLMGGLIQDLGYRALGYRATVQPGAAQSTRTIDTRSTPMPNDWRIVLVTSVCTGDMCGVHEDRLIDRAGAMPNPHREQMLQLADACTSAARHQNFEDFTSSLDHYMELAARLFAPVQAGRYRDEVTQQRVDSMRQAGLAAVGQSSWGPTVFGFSPSEDMAELAAQQLGDQIKNEAVRILVTRPLNQGVRWFCRAQEVVQYAS